MSLESYNYGSVNGGRNYEPVRAYTDAEQAGRNPPHSPGPGGEYEERSPLIPDVLEMRDSRQSRIAISLRLVLLAFFLVTGGLGLAFSVLRGAKYGEFFSTRTRPPSTYGSLERQKYPVVDSCVLEQCSYILNGAGGVKPSVNSKRIMECLKDSNHDEAGSCFENTLDDKWSSSLHACCLCEGCISGRSPSHAECKLIKAGMSVPLEMAWYPAMGSPASLNAWQVVRKLDIVVYKGNYNGGEYFHGDWWKNGDKRFDGGWMSMEVVGSDRREDAHGKNSTLESQRISPLVKHNPLDAYGCLLTHCLDFALKFEATEHEVAQQAWTCLSSRLRNDDASSCLSHPASKNVVECGICKGCFSIGNNMEISEDRQLQQEQQYVGWS